MSFLIGSITGTDGKDSPKRNGQCPVYMHSQWRALSSAIIEKNYLLFSHNFTLTKLWVYSSYRQTEVYNLKLTFFS